MCVARPASIGYGWLVLSLASEVAGSLSRILHVSWQADLGG